MLKLMTSYSSKKYIKYDDYGTPSSAFDNIKHIIEQWKDKVIFEPFYMDGRSGQILKDMECTNVIHDKEYDFFEMVDKLDYDIIISNPPFTLKKDIMTKLKEIDKPFILIMPYSVLLSKYIRDLYRNDIQIIIPKKRIQFYRLNEEHEPVYNGKSNFDCFYFCHKCNLERDINWLN